MIEPIGIGGTTCVQAKAPTAGVLDTSGPPTLTAIAEDATAPAGDTVASIAIDGLVTH